jgi:hypothetical protein
MTTTAPEAAPDRCRRALETHREAPDLHEKAAALQEEHAVDRGEGLDAQSRAGAKAGAP